MGDLLDVSNALLAPATVRHALPDLALDGYHRPVSGRRKANSSCNIRSDEFVNCIHARPSFPDVRALQRGLSI